MTATIVGVPLLPLAFIEAAGKGVIAMLICALVATSPFWYLLILNIFAERRFLVTTVEEGTGKMLMRYGRAWRFLMANPDDECDPNWWIIPKGDEEAEEGLSDADREIKMGNTQKKPSRAVRWIEAHLLPSGMRWIGWGLFGYRIFEYNFRWSVLRASKPAPTEEGLVDVRSLGNGKWVASFAKRIDYIFLRDAVYYAEVIDAETQELMSVDIRMVMTIRVVNPYLALFRVHDWLSSSTDLVRPSVRSWVKKQPYQDVVGKPEAAQWEYDVLLKQTDVSPSGQGNEGQTTANIKTTAQYLTRSYGVRFKRIAFDEVNPPKEYADAATKALAADREKNRVLTLADAESGRIKRIAVAEAAATRLAARAFKDGGEAAITARTIEALEKTNPVLVGDQPVTMLINAVGGKATLAAGTSEKKGGKE